MEELNAQIKELHQLLQALIKRFSNLQKENEHLKQLNKELNAALSEQESAVRFTQEKIAAKNLASIYNDEDKKFLQQTIDLYLRDIEKCLSLLNA